MSQQLWLLYYESATYAGYGQHAVVRATNVIEAEMQADPYMEIYFSAQDGDQYEEENGTDDYPDQWASFVSCEPLDYTHPSWNWINDPGQAQFYEFVGVTQGKL